MFVKHSINSVDLPAPMVIIEPKTPDAPLAGTNYTLTCTAEVVEGLVVVPVVWWTDPSNKTIVSGIDFTVRDPVTVGNITTVTLTFNSLHTSHGGEYTCQATITIEEISISDLSGQAVQRVNVTSKCAQTLIDKSVYKM